MTENYSFNRDAIAKKKTLSNFISQLITIEFRQPGILEIRRVVDGPTLANPSVTPTVTSIGTVNVKLVYF